MFEADNINIYKLYVLIGFALVLLFRILPVPNIQFRISRKELMIFLVFATIGAHSLLFSVDMSRSSHIFQGILWLALIYLAKLNFGAMRSLSIANTFIKYAAILIVAANFGALAFLGVGRLSVEGNFLGLTKNSNFLATLLAALCFPFFLGLIAQNPAGFKRAGIFLLLSLSALLLILTRSRTGIIAISVTTIIYFIFLSKNKGGLALTFLRKWILIFAFGMIVLFSFAAVMNKYEGKDILDTRANLIQLRLQAIAERPFIGWGFAVNKFTEYDRFHKYNAGEKGNTLLAIIEEMGLIFGSIVILYLFMLFWRAIRVFSANKFTMPFALILTSSAVQLQGETWLFNFNGIVGLAIWGLLYLSLSLQSGHMDSARSKDRWSKRPIFVKQGN